MGRADRERARFLRRNGDGIDPARGVVAWTLGCGRLPDGGVRFWMRNETGRALASIDWDLTDVRALRDQLSAILRTKES